jgi:hypothetical protein
MNDRIRLYCWMCRLSSRLSLSLLIFSCFREKFPALRQAAEQDNLPNEAFGTLNL